MPKSPRIFFYIFGIIFLVFSSHAFALESRSMREAVIAPRTKKFYKASRAKQYLSLTGNYSSDYNSRDYQYALRYLYQSNKFVHELNFDNEIKYADVGSGKKKRYDVKTSELYDIAFASKMRLFSSQFYGVIYHRTLYDDLSDYYYDNRSAGGLGYVFFKDKIELDFSISTHDIKTAGQNYDYITSWRINHKIFDNLTFIQRAYYYFDNNSADSEYRSSLAYRLSNKMSFEVRHSFEKRRYKTSPTSPKINQVSRSINIGFIFDLGESAPIEVKSDAKVSLDNNLDLQNKVAITADGVATSNVATSGVAEEVAMGGVAGKIAAEGATGEVVVEGVANDNNKNDDGKKGEIKLSGAIGGEVDIPTQNKPSDFTQDAANKSINYDALAP